MRVGHGPPKAPIAISTIDPVLETTARECGRAPDEIDRVRQVGVSYAPDYDEALAAAGFWRGPRAIGFHQDVADPREIERLGREVPIEAMADAWLVTTDPDDIAAAIEESAAVGFDEVTFLSTSPDQDRFIEVMNTEILPAVA